MHWLFTFIRNLYRESSKDGLLRHSAAVSYYAVFSLPAFLAALGLFLGSIIVSIIAVFNSIGSVYGVAANLLVLMFWMFFCGNVFFLGAESIDLLSRKNIAK